MVAERLSQLLLGAVALPLALVGYVAAAEWLLGRLPRRRQSRLRPWLWAGPALALLAALLVYPMVNTVYLSFRNAASSAFVGLENYRYVLTSPETLLAARNNLVWLVFFTLFAVGIGLAAAVLADRVRYEAAAKSVLFMPMAISFVAAGVIWKFMYDYRPPGSPQTGALNALLTGLVPGAQPRAWLVDPLTNNGALILVMVWMMAGFCTVVLSAGLKSIPAELLEAARVDGASERQVLARVTLPLLAPTLAVVATTMLITALKAFDVVYLLTNGNFDTDILALRMYKELFSARNYGHASAIAVVLLLAVAPVMAANVRAMRR